MDGDLQNLDEGFENVYKYDYDDKPFRLFDLPAEIWSQICEMAVVKKRPIEITCARDPQQQVEVVKQPAITRTCRLLRQEGLLMFYRLNTFEARHRSRVACARYWFAAIGKENMRAMREWRIREYWMPKETCEKWFHDTEMEATVEVDTEGETALVTFL